MQLKNLLLLFLSLAVGACTAPLKPVRYSGDAVVTSDLPASVRLTTGVVTGFGDFSALGGLLSSSSSLPAKKVFFGVKDQEVFVESLRSELIRLGIVSSVSAVTSAKQCEIEVYFAKTEHYSGSDVYKLYVDLLITYKGSSAIQTYVIASSEEQSFWERLNSSPSKEKQKAAAQLMDRLISDVESFLQPLIAETVALNDG